MSESNQFRGAALVGRFVVELPGERRTGLAAHEVQALLETPEGRDAAVYLVHRVADEGQMELVGVSPGALGRQDFFFLTKAGIAELRHTFDAIEVHAQTAAPPCRVEMKMAQGSGQRPVIVLAFAAVCADAVWAWMKPIAGDVEVLSGSRGLAEFDVFSLQVVRQVDLDANV